VEQQDRQAVTGARHCLSMKLPLSSQQQQLSAVYILPVKTGDMQTAKVAQITLDSGNDKLNEAMNQLMSKHPKRSYKAS